MKLALLVAPILFTAPILMAATAAKPQDTEQWQPVPPVVSAPVGAPPADARVLFAGHDLDEWLSSKDGPCPWKIVDGNLQVVPQSGDIHTREVFADLQLHLEWRTPAKVEGNGQERGNSGVFFMRKYELQVLDSYENPTY